MNTARKFWYTVLSGGGGPSSDWILATGVWNDSGVWDDDETWMDS